MIVTVQQLKEKYKDYSNPLTKINREIKNGNLFPLIRGLYETDPNVDGVKLAQFIYGPSYVSFEYALNYHGLIPEAVYNTYTCATFNKRKAKTYKNRFGTYTYRDVPKCVFSLGVQAMQGGGYTYLMASPEKALCDKLYTLPPIKSIKVLRHMLFENLRIDEQRFQELNKADILKIAPLYRCTNLNLLEKLLEGMK